MMTRTVYAFTFNSHEQAEEAESVLAWAITDVEYLRGASEVRLSVRYATAADRITVDVSAAAGMDVAKIFTGLCSERYGEGGYTVKREEREWPYAPTASPASSIQAPGAKRTMRSTDGPSA